ncbi:UDP-glycosyltransferase 84B2-like [Mangifera indica]|uniref:UDP-glycosyltransferase 84B2-like n=1 Tax=Mangifera indica TaxID=29780 RepID=UPI001CFAE5DA|nr:UDP-glycosyltransferase 84B2-like [Mangifera indica]
MALTEDKQVIHHVLLVAFAAQGHINPLLRLGKRLVSKGLHVTLACTGNIQERLLKQVATTNTEDESNNSSNNSKSHSISGIQLLFFSDGFDLDYDRKADLDHYFNTLEKVGPVNLSNMIIEHYYNNHKKLSCIVINPFVPWAADVAVQHRVPCALLWIQPCSIFAIYYRFFNKLNSFPTSENPDLSVELPGLPVLSTEDLPSFVLPSNPFNSLLKMISGLYQNMKKHKWVLANSFLELEKDVIHSMSELCPIRPVGPLVPTSLLCEDEESDVGVELWKPEDACSEWLNKQSASSVIYVSFGSITVLSAKQMEAIATALKNSNHPFLWVAKQPEVPTSDGAGQLPNGFIEETKDQGFIASWCPQTKVLAHPAIVCFITHCGWNSLSETIAAGVPVITFPQWSDQPTNAKLVTDVFKIGLKLRRNSEGIVSTEEVETCIEEIINGPKSEEYKKNVMELKAAATKAVASGGSSDMNIQWLVDEISNGNSCESEGFHFSK